LKRGSNQEKLEKAKEFYAKGSWQKAIGLFENVAPYYKGSQEADNILYMIADSYYNNKMYLSAINYYKAYINNYPQGEFIIESRYMVGYCYYSMSPEAKLDQTETYNAIEAFETFLQLFPFSERSAEASKFLLEMTDKLAYKELLNVQLYYKLGNFQGNNYLSAIITAENALNTYPSTQYREEFAILILQSKYMQAVKSIEAKKEDRYRETIDQYFVYAGEFPKGKYIKEAEKIFSDSEKHTKN
jgi:outer membrane protein assembly factor BamD